MFKKISAITTAVLLSLTFTVTAFAADKSNKRSKATSATTNSVQTEPPQATTTEPAESEVQTTLPNYLDDKYDTEGNASLIQSKKVIYNGAEMQFIAVTTKAGNVFYVLINHSDKDGDNVYFLNKVDEYDLYALLHQNANSDESGQDNTPVVPPEQAVTSAAENTKSSTDDNSESSEKESEEPTKQSHSNTKSLLIIIAVGAAIAGGFIFIKKKDKGGSSKAVYEEDDLDFEEDEINEDDE